MLSYCGWREPASHSLERSGPIPRCAVSATLPFDQDRVGPRSCNHRLPSRTRHASLPGADTVEYWLIDQRFVFVAGLYPSDFHPLKNLLKWLRLSSGSPRLDLCKDLVIGPSPLRPRCVRRGLLKSRRNRLKAPHLKSLCEPLFAVAQEPLEDSLKKTRL